MKMKNKISIVSFVLAIMMLVSVLAGCAQSKPNVTHDDTVWNTTSTEEGSNKETEKESAVESTEESFVLDTEKESTLTTDEPDESEDAKETVEESSDEVLGDIANGELIEHAHSLSNGVQTYFSDAKRDGYVINNQNMSLEYLIDAFDDQRVSYLKNTAGASYIEDTMDIFVKMKDGKTFYAADSLKNTTTNIYRLGYYYYHVLLQGQDFAGAGIIEDDANVPLKLSGRYEITKFAELENGGISFSVKNNKENPDPRIVIADINHSTEAYNAIQIKIKANTSANRTWEVFIKSGSGVSFSYDQYVNFLVSPSEEYYTYTVMLNSINDYNGMITGLRIDTNGETGESYEIESLKFVKVDDGGAAQLYLNRSFHVYSDKLHHTAQIVATKETNDIESIGMMTQIPADKVNKVIVFDKNGFHNTLEGVDWESAEYVGFDIADAGIFGLIIPYDQTDDRLYVNLADGIYTIIQSRTPENNTIIPSEVGTGNANDFYIGQRIYTDENHNFDTFIYEATCERNPLTKNNFKASESTSDKSQSLGYDSLRGVYVLTVDGTGFNDPYFGSWNRHYRVDFTVRCDDVDRNIYVMTASTYGSLECAVLLDNKEMLLPIPIEVCKNFYGDGEDNIYNLDDANYSEAIFPMVLKADTKYQFNVLNLYQNWGNYPLKQISSIQFHAPYYHLSTGVTESNCIMPWTVAGPRLPDHRAASAPFWEKQPQHTSGGHHEFLQYTIADGTHIGSENTNCHIGSYGPTYADVTLDYITDDGKIKVVYNHMEFPQLDENRGYYEMKYEVLEDITFADFKNEFKFFSMKTNNATGIYKSLGYLDENNQPAVVSANTSKGPKNYLLGDDCPYFDYFELQNYKDDSGNGYVNIAFLVYNSSFVIGGKEEKPKFIINDFENTVTLSLNLDSVTLKAGDTFTINSIIMPWGSQETVYDGSNGKAPDQNVRDVRDNTLKNPLKAEAVANCEVIESVYVPRFRTIDGKSADFTISGGENNVAVRVYGFDKLTAPKVYELVDGEWKIYGISSFSDGEYDYMGNAHNYDGYMVYYDGDGTFSYSFVTTMKDGAPRTFRIVADEDFKEWDKVPEKVPYDPLEYYTDAVEFYQKTGSSTHFNNIVLAPDTSYISFYSKDQFPESYIQMFAKKEDIKGQYIALKYRLPESNTKKISVVEFMTSTQNATINGKDSLYLSNSLIADGEWHVLIVDIVACGIDSFVANDDGTYTVRYLRFDIFNTKMDADNCMDIAYLGITDSIDKIRELESDTEILTIAKSRSKTYYYNNKTGEVGEEIEIVKDTTTPSTPTVPNTPEIPDIPDDSGDATTIVEFSPELLQNKASSIANFGSVALSEDKSYVSFVAKESAKEATFHVFTGGSQPTGKYVVLRYRLPETNTADVTTIEFYTSSVNAQANAADSTYYQRCLINDGEWHVVIFNIVSHGGCESYTPDENGNYVAKYLRFDVFNTSLPDGTQMDVSFLGMTNSIDSVIEKFADVESFTLATSEGKNELIDRNYKAE